MYPTTDHEVVKTMLTRAGVNFSEMDPPDRGFVIMAQDGRRNLGHTGFFTELRFSTTGCLDSVGAWEE